MHLTNNDRKVSGRSHERATCSSTQSAGWRICENELRVLAVTSLVTSSAHPTALGLPRYPGLFRPFPRQLTARVRKKCGTAIREHPSLKLSKIFIYLIGKSSCLFVEITIHALK